MFGGPVFITLSPNVQPQCLHGDTSPGGPRLGPLLSSFPSLVPPTTQRHSPDTFLSLRHSFQGLHDFFAGFDLPLRHFLEWPLGVCPHPDGIQMQTPPSPQLWLLSWGKLILTPTSHPPPASLALFLEPEVRPLRLTPPPAPLSPKPGLLAVSFSASLPRLCSIQQVVALRAKANASMITRAVRCSCGPGKKRGTGCVTAFGEQVSHPEPPAQVCRDDPIQMRKLRGERGTDNNRADNSRPVSLCNSHHIHRSAHLVL